MQELLSRLEREQAFQGSNYNLYKKNCNHFSDALSKLMLKSEKSVVPGWVNRAASLGNTFGMGGGNNGGADQQQQQQAEEDKHKYQAFAGSGRVLGTKSMDAAAHKKHPAAADGAAAEDHGGFFSRLFGRS